MRQLLLLLTAFLGENLSAQTLQINELMQSNIDCIMDDLNDFPDSWVELYNPSETAVNLQDYKIGTKDKAAKAWQLPDETIGPKQYALIYCDKAGEDEGVSAMHTDFRLESGKGCNVYLFKGNDIVDQVTDLKKQPAPNIAYGRKTEGSDEWGYQQTPTPKTANCGTLCKNILGEPVFSQKGQVFTGGGSITLNITLPEDAPEGTQIRITTNGSEPTAESPLFTTPLQISSTRVIRAKLFCDGYLSPRATCHSYIFFPTSRELTLPVISITTNKKYLDDPKIGIYTEGSYKAGKKNYEFDWRRPITFEFFEKGGEDSKLNQLCETRIAGGATRGNMRKTLAIYANKRFGTKRLEYEFFPDQKPGLTDFKSIMLRNAGNDFDYLFMRDAIIQRTAASRIDLDWQAWRPAIVYINGEYTGMLNIRERSNEDNIYTNYGGLEDIDMFENWAELKEGDWDNYNAFKAFYNEKGHTLAEYSQWMDWEEFINLMVPNLFFNNVDFPGNNIVMWRPKAEGGKWRWIMKDTDYSMGLYDQCPYNYKILEWLYNPDYDWNLHWDANGYDATRLFRRLMDDADFRREFIDRACIYMGDFLNEKGTRELWDPMYETIKTEYPFHRELVNRWWPNYNDELTKAHTWLKRRTDEFYKQIGNYYQLGSPVALTINKGKEDQVSELTFNGIKLSKTAFDGKFFANRQITISGKDADGTEIKKWKVIGSETTEVDGSELTLQMTTSSLTIQPIVGDANGISEVHTQTTADDDPIYDLTGRQVATPQKGRIYVRNGKKYIKR